MKYLNLYDGCFPVEGFRQSLFINILQRKFLIVPNEYFFKIKSLTIDGKPYEENNNDVTLQSFIDHLLDAGFCYFNSKPESFSPYTVFDSPVRIANAIYIFKKESKLITSILEQLSGLGCRYLELRIVDQNLNPKDIISIVNVCRRLKFKSINLVISKSKDLNIHNIRKIASYSKLISHIAVFNCHEKHREAKIDLVTNPASEIVDNKSCGVLSEFTINISHFTESKNFNSCLHKKITIDIDGNIKNCPSMQDNFGNINDTSLAKAIEKPGFKKYWNINKDKINVCQDCEFRYICTDCRAYVEDPKDLLSKPLKCGYNPYTGEWSEWSTNPLNQKAIEFYGMHHLVKS